MTLQRGEISTGAHDDLTRAAEILSEKRDVLERMTRRLFEVETLDRKEIERVIETAPGADPEPVRA